jgi:hypothetical protein
VRAYLIAEGALTEPGDILDRQHPFVVTVAAILDNFREAYWIAAQAVLELRDGGLPQKAVLDRIQKRYRTGLLLGEVHKPEGNSSVTLGNALNRFAELECVQVRSGKGKERTVLRGARFDALPTIAARIGAGVIGGGVDAPAGGRALEPAPTAIPLPHEMPMAPAEHRPAEEQPPNGPR